MSYRKDSLHARLLAGDEAALEDVRRWISTSLTAPRFWQLRTEWRDLQQEILCSIIESLRLERFHPDGEFRRYVWGICRHAALDRLASHARRTETRSTVELDSVPANSRTELDAISAQLVRRALDDSSRECREMIRAYFLEGKTYAELSAELGIPVGTAKSKLFRCLQCIRRSMAAARAGRHRLEESAE